MITTETLRQLWSHETSRKAPAPDEATAIARAITDAREARLHDALSDLRFWIVFTPLLWAVVGAAVWMVIQLLVRLAF